MIAAEKPANLIEILDEYPENQIVELTTDCLYPICRDGDIIQLRITYGANGTGIYLVYVRDFLYLARITVRNGTLSFQYCDTGEIETYPNYVEELSVAVLGEVLSIKFT